MHSMASTWDLYHTAWQQPIASLTPRAPAVLRARSLSWFRTRSRFIDRTYLTCTDTDEREKIRITIAALQEAYGETTHDRRMVLDCVKRMSKEDPGLDPFGPVHKSGRRTLESRYDQATLLACAAELKEGVIHNGRPTKIGIGRELAWSPRARALLSVKAGGAGGQYSADQLWKVMQRVDPDICLRVERAKQPLSTDTIIDRLKAAKERLRLDALSSLFRQRLVCVDNAAKHVNEFVSHSRKVITSKSAPTTNPYVLDSRAGWGRGGKLSWKLAACGTGELLPLMWLPTTTGYVHAAVRI
jgi:hypothetical protein